MTAPEGGPSAERLGAEDWRRWREVRLRSLGDSPSAFGSTFEREQGFDEPTWRGRLVEPTSVSVLVREAGRDVGIGGGFADAPGLLHVVAMWVDPAARGRRLADLVLEELRRFADEQGRRLHLDVNVANDAARRTYERFGFVVSGETRPLREGSDEVVVRMVLP